MRYLSIIITAVWIVGLITGCAPHSPEPTGSPAASGASAPTGLAEEPVAVDLSKTGCTVQSISGQPDPTLESLLPPPTSSDWTIGPGDAFVTLTEYADFQCPACASLLPVLKQLQEKYPQDLQIVYRHFPLSSHDKSRMAVQAAEAAGMQGKFWQLHDLLFENQATWSSMQAEEFSSWLSTNAALLELNLGKFEEDLKSESLVQLAASSYEKNAAIGMPGTPFLTINGEPYSGPLDYGNLDATVGLILLQKRQFSECPSMAVDPKKHYLAVLKTDKGDITLELFSDKAPIAVNSFIFLAGQGWFDGVTFHRVISGFVAQAGDPTGTGFGGPGYAFVNEIAPGLNFNQAGLVAMANAGAGTNGSQFFITYSATPDLNGKYTIFGKVISGMDVVESLTPRDPSQSMDLPPGDKILNVEIVEK